MTVTQNRLWKRFQRPKTAHCGHLKWNYIAGSFEDTGKNTAEMQVREAVIYDPSICRGRIMIMPSLYF
jgi:hypothetical protein